MEPIYDQQGETVGWLNATSKDNHRYQHAYRKRDFALIFIPFIFIEFYAIIIKSIFISAKACKNFLYFVI